MTKAPVTPVKAAADYVFKNSKCMKRIAETFPRSRYFSAQTIPPVASPFKYDAPWMVYDNNDVPTVANFINGSFEPSDPKDTNNRIPLHDPSTNSLISYVPQPSAATLSHAVESAQNALPSWRNTPVQSRQRLLIEYAHHLRQPHVWDEVAYWITLEQGKTMADAKGDVWRGIEVVESAGRVATDMLGDTLQNLSNGLDTMTFRVPLGVCAGVAPFNFPAMIPLWMFPLAIATGNTFVLKPTERAPSASLCLARHLHQLGLPPGVLNIVHGGKQTVDHLCDDESIQAVSFVGSNRVGEYIHERGSKNGKRVQANLGAKNHATVMTMDADRSSTIKALVGAAFGAAGQRCMALSVVILVGTQEETRGWVDDMANEAKKLKVGNGFEEGVDVGPLISVEAKERAENIIEKAVKEGATCILDGRGIVVDGYEDGNFVGPTVLLLNEDHIQSDCSISNVAYTEEIFAPVLTVLTVPTLDDAIAITNVNPYGNGCAIFTSSGGAARKYQYEVEAGQIGINVPIPVPLPFFSFTGNKASIRGDVNFYGKSGVNFYTQCKTVTSNWQYRAGADLGGVVMPVLGSK